MKPSLTKNNPYAPYLLLLIQPIFMATNTIVARGLKYSAKEYGDAADFMKQSYESYKEVFEDYHGIITPSSSGVADKGLKSTGSADFQKIWTYLGLPTISLPLLTGENDLPLGVQLVGDKLDDLRFLGTANWLEKNCRDEG